MEEDYSEEELGSSCPFYEDGFCTQLEHKCVIVDN